ncbi:DUF4271 domain-containing protein [Lutibacter sp. TH_r2]|uniref:DUF4271 domain-containing protein n=1 Tax=Lutibacter sp. TH_r2 TaxID=3082083 RepID=UPI0039867737
MIEAHEIIKQDDNWITFSFLIILILIALLRFVYNERLVNISTLFFSKKYLLIYFNKENNSVRNLFQITLFIVQILTISILIYLSSTIFLSSVLIEKGLKTYVFIVLGVLFYFSVRYLIGKFISFIFNLNFLHNKLIYEKTNYLNNLILWILPFLVLSFYNPLSNNLPLKFTIIITVILLIMRYILLVINNKKLVFNSLFYFILYLCALEIAPLVIILKLTI